MAMNRRDLLIASGGALTAAMAGRALAQEAQGQPMMGNPTLVLNADYSATDIPVPEGVGPVGSTVFLRE